MTMSASYLFDIDHEMLKTVQGIDVEGWTTDLRTMIHIVSQDVDTLTMSQILQRMYVVYISTSKESLENTKISVKQSDLDYPSKLSDAVLDLQKVYYNKLDPSIMDEVDCNNFVTLRSQSFDTSTSVEDKRKIIFNMKFPTLYAVQQSLISPSYMSNPSVNHHPSVSVESKFIGKTVVPQVLSFISPQLVPPSQGPQSLFVPPQASTPFVPPQASTPFVPPQASTPFVPPQASTPFVPPQASTPFVPPPFVPPPFVPPQASTPFVPPQDSTPSFSTQTSVVPLPAQTIALDIKGISDRKSIVPPFLTPQIARSSVQLPVGVTLLQPVPQSLPSSIAISHAVVSPRQPSVIIELTPESIGLEISKLKISETEVRANNGYSVPQLKNFLKLIIERSNGVSSIGSAVKKNDLILSIKQRLNIN
jgi:hypothetical protein